MHYNIIIIVVVNILVINIHILQQNVRRIWGRDNDLLTCIMVHIIDDKKT